MKKRIKLGKLVGLEFNLNGIEFYFWESQTNSDQYIDLAGISIQLCLPGSLRWAALGQA